MQIKDILSKLGVTNTTLSNWIDKFGGHFSEGAKGRKRTFTQEDLDTLATIATLSAGGLDYKGIERRLQTGEREAFEDTTLGVDLRVMPVAAVEQMIDASGLKIELEHTRAAHNQAQEQLKSANAEIKTLRDEIRELERKLGRLEGRLEEIDKRKE